MCVCVCLFIFLFSMHVVCTRVCVLMCVLMCVAKSSPVIPCASSGPGSIVACFRMVFHSLGLPSTDIHSTSLKDDRILHCPFGTSPCNKSSCIQCICWTLFFHVFSTSTSHTARSIEGKGIAIAQGFLMSVSHSQCFLLCMNGPCQGPQG